MNSGDAGNKNAELTGYQAEVLQLLEKLVSLVAANPVVNMRPLPEVYRKLSIIMSRCI
jgi:hypothetical protein